MFVSTKNNLEMFSIQISPKRLNMIIVISWLCSEMDLSLSPFAGVPVVIVAISLGADFKSYQNRQ